jgi:alpha-galactosidase
MSTKHLLFIILASMLSISASNAQNKKDFHSWAATPPMGWNSWDCFGPTVVENEVKANTDLMVGTTL